MGCEDLYEIISPEWKSFSEFSDSTIAIDATFWFDRYYHAIIKDNFSIKDRQVVGKYHISQTLALLVSIPDLLRNNVTPVFFFDHMESHSQPKADAKVPYLEHSPASNPERQFAFLQRSTELVLKYLDISYYEAPRDAEADASKYVKEGKADMVVSRDYDTLLYQAPVTMRKKQYSESWQKIDLEKVLEENAISYRELLDAAILAGTDEVIGPYKGHIDEAIEKIKRADDLSEFERNKNDSLRAPSGRVSDKPPSFGELHEIYRHPPISHSLRKDIYNNVDPSISNPSIDNLVRYLNQMIKMDDETVNDIITPIREEL